jgi:hypothetical protein
MLVLVWLPRIILYSKLILRCSGVALCLWLGDNGVALSLVNEHNILIGYGPIPPSE